MEFMLFRKGLTKAINRLPHLVRQKAGTAEESRDADFDVLARKYEASACATERLLLDMKKYVEGVRSMLEHQRELVNCFKHVLRAGDQASCGLSQLEASRSEILQVCERDLAGKGLFVLGELVAVQKAIATKITKRAHKLLDYDRHMHTAKKFEQINERSISEERKMAQAERALEEAQEEYEKYNEQLKRDLPRYFELEARLVEPILATLISFQRTLYAKQQEAHALILASEGEAKVEATEYRTILSGYETAVGGAQAQLNELSLLQAATGRVKKSSGRTHTRTSSSASCSSASGSSVRSLKTTTNLGGGGPLASPREVPLRTVSPTPVEPQKFKEDWMAPPIATTRTVAAIPPRKSTETFSPPPPTQSSLRTGVEGKTAANPPPPPAPAASSMVKSPSGSRVAELAARLGAIQVAVPPKPNNNTAAAAATTTNNNNSSSNTTPLTKQETTPLPTLPPLPPKKLIVRAEYDFVGHEAGDLSFRAGDLVEVTSRTDSTEDWWTGRIGDRTGIFPANYCTTSTASHLRPSPSSQA